MPLASMHFDIQNEAAVAVAAQQPGTIAMWTSAAFCTGDARIFAQR
jgi:hypothetical protein